MSKTKFEKTIEKMNLRMTAQRRIIARVLADSQDHPDVAEVFRLTSKIDPTISISTVYRTLRLFSDAGILERHNFGDRRSRYEEATESHHDHLINIENGTVIEFKNPSIEVLKKKVAEDHGMRLIGHRLELYCTPIKN